jgi:Cu2+-exporting ATPase
VAPVGHPETRFEPAGAESGLSGADGRAPCFHCGLPVPPGSGYSAVIDGAARAMCCAGCQAVAQTIAAGGFEAYYRDRTGFAPAAGEQAAPDQLDLYDLPEVQRGFVRELPGGLEATLLLEGITCAACIWLNEQHLARLPGVQSVEINYTNRRARVHWDPARVRLSEILRAVQAIGYRAFPAGSADAEASRKRENRAALWRLFVAGFGMMQVMMYAVPTYLAEEGTMSADIEQLMRIAGFVLTVPVVIYACGPFFRGALRDLQRRRLGMDVPIAVGIGVSFAASVIATFGGVGEVYYDSITMFVFFLLGGRYLEQRARQRAAASLDYLDRALPLSAQRLQAYPATRDTEAVPAASLRQGDFVLVRPGETVPADGRIVDGRTHADESLITGESRPIEKGKGAGLVAGSVNRTNAVVMEVERAGEDTRASHIRRLTDRAASQRPRIVEATDRIAGWFVAGVLACAGLAALWWAQADASRALWIAVSVLVVTCPCALSLATPTALAVAVGAAARRGVVATRAHALETLAQATHFVFDKTGTLTLGRLALCAVVPGPGVARERVLALASALERSSEHPLARALLDAAEVQHIGASGVASEVRNVAGSGVEARIGGTLYRIGTRAFVTGVAGAGSVDGEPAAGCTPVWLGNEQGWLARLEFQDQIRPEAQGLIEALRGSRRAVSILSGDDPAAVASVAGALGVQDHAGGCTPEDKHARVKALQARGAVVAMVGDGVNDAPVLAQAQVSIAMGSGAVLSQAQSDLVLLEGRLAALNDAIGIAGRTMRIVRQNLAWAVAYNVIALPLAMAGYVTPWLAGIGMAGSSLLVVLNALRLAGASPQAYPSSPSPQPSPPLGAGQGARG